MVKEDSQGKWAFWGAKIKEETREGGVHHMGVSNGGAKPKMETDLYGKQCCPNCKPNVCGSGNFGVNSTETPGEGVNKGMGCAQIPAETCTKNSTVRVCNIIK